jgi:hypothetical protein
MDLDREVTTLTGLGDGRRYLEMEERRRPARIMMRSRGRTTQSRIWESRRSGGGGGRMVGVIVGVLVMVVLCVRWGRFKVVVEVEENLGGTTQRSITDTPNQESGHRRQ